MDSPETFYDVFEYDDTYFDGGDKTINFDEVKIIRDIPKLGLKKGTEYTQCWWNIEKMTFHFIVWNAKPRKDGSYYPDPKQSLIVSQKKLATHLVWNRAELPTG